MVVAEESLDTRVLGEATSEAFFSPPSIFFVVLLPGGADAATCDWRMTPFLPFLDLFLE